MKVVVMAQGYRYLNRRVQGKWEEALQIFCGLFRAGEAKASVEKVEDHSNRL